MLLLSLIAISVIVIMIKCHDEQSKSHSRQLRYEKNGLEEDKSQPDDVMICGSLTLTSIGSSSDNSFIGMKVLTTSSDHPVKDLATLLYSDGNLYTTYGTSTSVINLTGAFQPVQGSNPRSISFDMKTLSSGTGPIIHTGTTDVLKAFGIFMSSSTVMVYAWNANFLTTRVVNDGQWHSVLVTFDGNTLIVYIDGVIDGSISASSWFSG